MPVDMMLYGRYETGISVIIGFQALRVDFKGKRITCDLNPTESFIMAVLLFRFLALKCHKKEVQRM